jgi:predicted metal-dependent HD superfamily phosphohydrolase
VSDYDALLRRWRALWPDGAGAAVDAAYHDLIARYAEPHRAYHTLDHVAACLRWLDEARPLPARPAETEWAIWFHDAVYDPRRADNEVRSAELAERALRACGVAEEAAQRVANLVRATSHSGEGLTGDASVLGDIDLAILGAPPLAFDAYDAAIRQEYGWVPEEIFRRERAKVLASFLARPRVYLTEHFHNRLESPARDNLARTIAGYSRGIEHG